MKCRAEGYFSISGDYGVGETHYDDKGRRKGHMLFRFDTQEEAEKFMDGYSKDVIQVRNFGAE